MVYFWCGVCRGGNADFFTWFQGLMVISLLWGLSVLAWISGLYLWLSSLAYLFVASFFVGLWDSSLCSERGGTEECETSTVSVIRRILNSTDHYSTLGILQDANQERIRDAAGFFKRLLSTEIKEVSSGGTSCGMEVKFIKDALRKEDRAVQVLSKPHERHSYNKLLESAVQNGIAAVLPNGGVAWDPNSSAQIAGHMLACSVCGKAHRRIIVDRDPRHARWCHSCHCYHEAFIGDGWAETEPISSSWLMPSHVPTAYYVCMEDGIFQVTEWASCQQIVISPNTHRVPFTITTNPQQEQMNVKHGLVPNRLNDGASFGGSSKQHKKEKAAPAASTAHSKQAKKEAKKQLRQRR